MLEHPTNQVEKYEEPGRQNRQILPSVLRPQFKFIVVYEKSRDNIVYE